MSDLAGQNGWNEWSMHVLKELERLNLLYSQMSSDVSELKGRVVNYSAENLTRLQIEVPNLRASDADQEHRIREIENRVNTIGAAVDKVLDLERVIVDLQKMLVDLQQESAKSKVKWAILAMIGAAFISAAVGFAFKAFTSPADHLPRKEVNLKAIERTLSESELADLRQTK